MFIKKIHGVILTDTIIKCLFYPDRILTLKGAKNGGSKERDRKILRKIAVPVSKVGVRECVFAAEQPCKTAAFVPGNTPPNMSLSLEGASLLITPLKSAPRPKSVNQCDI